jgi:hypothetical protein
MLNNNRLNMLDKSKYLANANIETKSKFLIDLNTINPTNIIKSIKNTTLRDNLSKFRITQDKKEIKELLSSDYLHYYILSGKEGITKILYPLLSQMFDDDNKIATDKERKEIVNNLRLAYDKACELADNEIDIKRTKEINEGLGYFKETIDEIIAPYNF